MGWPLALGQLTSPAVYAPQSSSSKIVSIQQGTITLTSPALSNTATISSVNTANAIIIYDGFTTTSNLTTSYSRCATRIALTNSTTVTATRENTSNNVTIGFTVIEFASGVNSIQSGTIAIAGAGTSNTATISTVGSNAFVLWLGASTAAAGSISFADVQGGVELTNATTVTASCASGASLTIGYMVVDLDSTLVTSAQKIAKTDATSATSVTSTISSVNTANTLIFYGGLVTTFSTQTANGAVTVELTNSTTVTFTRSGNGPISRTSYATVVEFASSVLNSSVQRGSITLAAATSNTATISSVNTAKSFVNFGSMRGANAGGNVFESLLALSNSTTVTQSVNAAGSPTGTYEVIEFL